MTVLKYVHTGGIKKDGSIVYTTTAPSRPKLIYQINTWFFDYLYANSKTVKQLPPLDDWNRSHEDIHCWTIKFPDQQWDVWITQEQMEFK